MRDAPATPRLLAPPSAARGIVAAVLLAVPGCRLTPPVEVCTDCALNDENNFSYAADLQIATAPLAAAHDNLLGWAGLTQDIHGGRLAPSTDIDEAQLIGFRDLSQAEIADGIANETLEQADVTLYVVCTPEASSCKMSDFRIGRSGVDLSEYFLPGPATWLLALSEHGRAGAGGLLFLAPDSGAPTFADVIDSSSRLDVSVDLHSLAPVVVPDGEPALTLDWRTAAVDGLGNPLQLGDLDGAYVARFDAPINALEVDPANLASRADVDLWEGDIAGLTTADLSVFTNPADPTRAFPGVDTDGTWLFALTCSTCTNPAPRFVTVLTAAASHDPS